jgi:hypothetical protein
MLKNFTIPCSCFFITQSYAEVSQSYTEFQFLIPLLPHDCIVWLYFISEDHVAAARLYRVGILF